MTTNLNNIRNYFHNITTNYNNKNNHTPPPPKNPNTTNNNTSTAPTPSQTSTLIQRIKQATKKTI